MPTVHIDQSQVAFEQLATQDTDGTDVDTLWPLWCLSSSH
jgi:hypothetical protein